MPERSICPKDLKQLRRRWLHSARAHLAVSADTAADISGLLKTSKLISWCHPAPDPVFESTVSHGFVQDSWYACLLALV